jgi:hypothetical protein
MLDRLARNWSQTVIKDTRSLGACLFLTLAGLTFILLYLGGIVANDYALALGVLNLAFGLHRFERYGLLLLIDELKQKGN